VTVPLLATLVAIGAQFWQSLEAKITYVLPLGTDIWKVNPFVSNPVPAGTERTTSVFVTVKVAGWLLTEPAMLVTTTE
jgi:hypothetical protein